MFGKILNRYSIPTLIFEPRAGGGFYVEMDKLGAFKKKIGLGLEYRLKNRKDVLDPQRYHNFVQTKKGKMLILYSPSKGVLEPMSLEKKKLVDNSGDIYAKELKNISKEVRKWNKYLNKGQITQDEYDNATDDLIKRKKKIEESIQPTMEKVRNYETIGVEGFVLSAEEIAWKENFMNNVEKAFTIFFRMGFMQKYMPLIMLITFGFIMIMLMVIIRQDIAQIIEQVRQSVSGLSLPNAPFG